MKRSWTRWNAVGFWKRWCWIAVVVAFVFVDRLPAADAARFQAGVAKINLTPLLEMKAPLGGYGARKTTWHPDFMKTDGAEYGLNESMMRTFLDALQPTETRSTSLRVGDLVILGVPGEMAAQLGLEAKKKVRQMTGAGAVTIGGLADEWVSYILPAEEYPKGGYEASVSFYGDTLGRVVMDGLIRSAGGLK